MPGGWINLHLLLWKHIIYALTLVETEDEDFTPHAVWQATWTRLERKVLAKQVGIQTVLLRAESRGEDPPSLERKGAPIAPLADIDEKGKFVWNEDTPNELTKLMTPPKKTAR